MNARHVVPGIDKYPELEQQLNQRISRMGVSTCSSCARARLYREFSKKLRELVERDKLTRKR